ncbi:hypothetical protein RhiirC2_769605 [Rhizophagus irregularis]|uniref:F-box domain-containing protein n=1 Tax=Rhizophagus irregularis TaxID=588596 RepID=A0A2N1NYK4_9GLOM|nr:hypothetical protein RhiirC2_769605 [Rhizophagus irregularis]
MFRLNRDILYLIFYKELQNDKNTLYSCFLVNKTWCEIIIPILWKNPWKEGNEKLLYNIIFSYLSNDLKNKLKQQDKDFFLTNSYKKPFFDYISFCKHLNFIEIERIINIYMEKHGILIKNDIINAFINERTRFTHLYLPQQFDYQLHLIPGAEQCFSTLEFLYCKTNVDEPVFIGLTEICKSIKGLELYIEKYNNNYGIVDLIKSQRKLCNVHFKTEDQYANDSFCKILENSLMKHSNTIQYFKMTKPLITNILSSFMNLKILELVGKFKFRNIKWNCLESLSLPFLQILRASSVPITSLISIIENTSGHLIEINIYRTSHNEINKKRIIQAIYQNCPNLLYLKILFRNTSSNELENLLIKCKHLNGLFLIISDLLVSFNWDNLFNVLTRSPIGLFKFKFSYYYREINLNSLELFFDNWNGRHPMLLQMISRKITSNLGFYLLLEKYKTKGIIQKFDYNTWFEHSFKDFEWI